MRLFLAALISLAVIATTATAATPGLYRTDGQAARYLERTRHGAAFCLNGYYSRHEKRTHRHYPQHGQRFRSFGCTFTSRRTGKTSDLYLVTRPGGGYSVQPDR
jgi:hypothetical protein